MLKQKTFNRKLMVFTAVLMTVTMVTSVGVFAADGYWTTFQNSNYNQGVVGTPPGPLITTNTDLISLGNAGYNGVDVEPLIANYGGTDYAYVLNTGTSDYKLHKIDLSTGLEILNGNWSGGGVQIHNKNDFQLSTPVIDGTTLYVGATDAIHVLANPYFDSGITGWTPVPGAGSPTIAWASGAGFMTGGVEISQGTGGTVTTGAVQQSRTFATTGFTQLNFYYVVGNTTGSAPTGINVNAQISADGGTTWNTIYTNSSVTPGSPVYVTAGASTNFSTSPTTYLVKFEANYTTAAGSDGYAFFDTCDLTNYLSFIDKVENIDGNFPTVSRVVTLPGGGQLNSPLTYDNGKIYAGVWRDNSTGAYFQVDLATSPVNVTSFSGLNPGDGFYNAGVAVIPGALTNYIVFGGEDGTVYSYDEADLSGPFDTYSTGAGAIRSSITYDSDHSRIYFTSTGGDLWGLDIDSSGALTYAWNQNIGYSTSTPAYFNDNVYAGAGSFSTPGAVVSYDYTGTTLRWTYTTAAGFNNEAVQSSPVVYYDRCNNETYIYFTTNDFDGAGYCIQDNGTSASQVWAYPSSGGTYTAQGMAVADGYAVFGNDFGDVYSVH